MNPPLAVFLCLLLQGCLSSLYLASQESWTPAIPGLSCGVKCWKTGKDNYLHLPLSKKLERFSRIPLDSLYLEGPKLPQALLHNTDSDHKQIHHSLDGKSWKQAQPSLKGIVAQGRLGKLLPKGTENCLNAMLFYPPAFAFKETIFYT